MKNLSVLLALCAVVVLSGCFDVTTKVKVKSDGSGTVEQTILMSKAALEMEQAGKKKKEPFHNPARLKKEAAQFGAGVEYVSSKRVTTEDFDGYAVVCKFADINALRLSDDYSEKAAPKKKASDDEPVKPKTYTTFSFQKGAESELTIIMPPKKPTEKENKNADEKSDAAADSLPEAGLAMMKLFFKGMKVATYVEPQGEISSTNAHIRDGNRLTLAEIEFEKIFADTSSVRYLKSLNGDNSPEAMREVMRKSAGHQV